MDHLNFQRDIEIAEKLGIDRLHLDIMDGNNVPRYGIYPEIAKAISKVSNLPIDLHLMVNDVEFSIEQFLPLENLEIIYFHVEGNEKDLFRIIDKIIKANVKVGITINLSTPLLSITELLKSEILDGIMFMGIHPGVLDQVSRPEIIIRKLKELKNLDCGELEIQVDGGVTFDSITELAAHGVNSFVCGSSTVYKGVSNLKSNTSNSILIESNINRIKESLVGIDNA